MQAVNRAFSPRKPGTFYLRQPRLRTVGRAADIIVSARRNDPDGEKAKSLRALRGYLWTHRGRMRYRDQLRRGLPIGSGQIEGVCKHTLNRRLCLNNARWRPEHAQDMAALCCLHTSDQWEGFWNQTA